MHTKQYQIHFGTDGWRALIAREFTVENVIRVGKGIAKYLNKNTKKDKIPKIVIGYDTRFGGKLFAESLAISLLNEGIEVLMDTKFITTPMVSLAANKLNCDLGIIFTASHNPPSYQGLKIKGSYGGPALDSLVNQIVALIPDRVELPNADDYEALNNSDLKALVNLEEVYVDTMVKRFDIHALEKTQENYVFDAMNGSIQEFIQGIFPKMDFIRVDPCPTFRGTSPEPIEKNLLPLRETLIKGSYKLGLAVDGDADRIGLMNKDGEVIDAHNIMLILIWHLVKYKGQKGKVVTGFSSTQKIKALCKHLDLELEIVKIGFKHPAEIMLKEDILLAGEEAGGIATRGHIPERDGLWNILLIMEMLQETQKSMEEIRNEITDVVGRFSYQRLDLPLNRTKIDEITERLKESPPIIFGGKKVAYKETLDGMKFYFNEDEWLMFRASGTEPLLRIYAESETKEETFHLIELGRKYFEV
jgi:phosphomannomutase